MKVYIDLILLLNFGFDFLLLLATSYLLKRNVSILKLILGALFGSLSTLFLFFSISTFILFLLKIGISIGMIIISFQFKNIHFFFKNLIYLYFNSMILGGCLYFFNIQLSYKQVGLIFYHNGLSINFIILIVGSPLFLYFYIKQLKQLKSNQKCYYPIIFTLQNEYHLVGFIDTGNQTKSFYFKKGIHIINKNVISEELSYFYEPITTTSGTTLMKCFKVKEAKIGNKNFKNVIFGISQEYFQIDADVILNASIKEELNDSMD